MTQKQKMDRDSQGKILVRDLNPVITCRLCEGYFIDATTLVDCLHVFCRACILRHFENSKTGCPSCNTVYKKKSQTYFRSDPQIQSLVYKLVPSLYAKEIQRREDFYRSTGVRASSSCSDDSVIERERDMINNQEEMISPYVGDKSQFFSPDDSISLSLEYYQVHLDTTNLESTSNTPLLKTIPSNTDSESRSTDNSVKTSSDSEQTDVKSDSTDLKTDGSSDGESKNDETVRNCERRKEEEEEKECDRRFLQCPAAVSMKHLQKFIRMKYGLTGDHRVDIIYKGEVLPSHFSLMDVAYTFKWKKMKPMRFFYRIFTPMKIKPIKIVNTTLSTGGKQLQIVPVKPNPESPPPKVVESEEKTPEVIEEDKEKEDRRIEETEDQKNHKERLFAHLKLQSKVQVEKDGKKVPEKLLIKDCVFEYEEPDQEEIKRFAEKRDREWALQKKMDENRKEEDYVTHHFSKKRKKSKHSKSEFNLHKKRKLHAEIASNEAELKLKVKITNNGHKHKHHKSSSQVNEKTQTGDVSSKEKLFQMRQIRHKHVSSEDKNIQTVPSIKLSKDSSTSTEKIKIDPIEKPPDKESEDKQVKNEEIKVSIKPNEDIGKLKIKVENSSTVSESAVQLKQQNEATSTSTSPKVGTFVEPSSSKPGFTLKNTVDKEWSKKVPTVQLERNEQTEKQAQKTFLKPFQSYTEKHQKIEKQAKIENAKMKQMNNVKIQSKIDASKLSANNKSLERKIANLQQQCTIEAKPQEKPSFVTEKPKILTPHYPPGFTVSKIEQGVKRKTDDNENLQDKRPSLEITLISPPTSSPVQTSKPVEKPPVKRPPPATIPLERIKKSVKSGITIIPKLPERCDNIGALDLSKTSKSPDASPKPSPKIDTNGFSRPLSIGTPRPPSSGTEKNNIALSNLQMLSKVATEHPSLNNKPPQQNSVVLNKPKPQMPSLQTLKIPSLQNPGQMKTPNLQKLPKLNEIQKFRPTNPQIRNLRPNQNQNIRNIPNPSLLIRQQNQNRLSCQNVNVQQSSGDNAKTTPSVSSSSAPAPKDTATIVPIKNTLETKLQEKKEISV